MKSSDLLRNLPSVSELLGHPQVKSVVERLNQSVATTKVRGFLDDLRTELAQRADNLPMPTLREVVDRVTRYVARDEGWQLAGAINATGRFRGGPWQSPPLADAAVERMLLLSRDFALSTASTTADAVEQAKRLTGAPAAEVFSTRAGALSLVLTELAARPPLIVARGDLGEVDPGCRFTALCNSAGARMCEVGSVDSVSLDDYLSPLAQEPDEQGGVILRLETGALSDNSAKRQPSTHELADAVHQRDALLIEDLGAAPLIDLASAADDPAGPAITGATALSAAATLAAGADLVLIRSDGMTGGPEACIVLGDAKLIERLRQLPLAVCHRPTAATIAALAATLRLLIDPRRALLQTPILSLLSTPLANLRTRAERLSPQLIESPWVAHAEALPLPVESSRFCGIPHHAESFAIAIEPASLGVEELLNKLASASPGVRGRVDGSRVLLDLRTVFPRQDLALVAAFSDPGAPATTGNSGEAG